VWPWEVPESGGTTSAEKRDRAGMCVPTIRQWTNRNGRSDLDGQPDLHDVAFRNLLGLRTTYRYLHRNLCGAKTPFLA
jgi:hypothetical protein